MSMNEVSFTVPTSALGVALLRGAGRLHLRLGADEPEDDGLGGEDEPGETEAQEEAKVPATRKGATATKNAAPAAAAKKPAKLTMEGDVLPAFQEYARKHSREKAKALLAKLKVAAVREIPEAKWGKVMEVLTA